VGKQLEATTTRACFGADSELRGADLRQRQVAERSAAVPALVALGRDEPLGLRGGIELLLGEPIDPREPVAGLPSGLRIEEVGGERLGVTSLEPEVEQAWQRLVRLHVGASSGRRRAAGTW
jgi:hypothetical protein